MTLMFIVYLIGVLPAAKFVLILLCILFGILFACMLIGASIDLDVYGGESAKGKTAIATRSKISGKLWIPITLLAFALLIPGKTTMYTMVAAYAGQKIAETPQAQQIGSDAVDVLHELLAKAKRELKEDVKEETKK